MSEIVVTQAMNGDLNVTQTLEGTLNVGDIRYIDRAEFIDTVEDAVEEIGIDFQAQIDAEVQNRQNADTNLQNQINNTLCLVVSDTEPQKTNCIWFNTSPYASGDVLQCMLDCVDEETEVIAEVDGVDNNVSNVGNDESNKTYKYAIV